VLGSFLEVTRVDVVAGGAFVEPAPNLLLALAGEVGDPCSVAAHLSW